MPLKSKEVTIEIGEDKGKTFLLTQMPALQAENWAMRALGVMVRSGLPLPEDIISRGIEAFTMLSVRSLLGGPWDEVKPLLDELLACVQIKEPKITRAVQWDSDVTEIVTIVKLREEVLSLHLGFSLASALLEAIRSAGSTLTSSDTPTSAQPSEPSSEAA